MAGAVILGVLLGFGKTGIANTLLAGVIWGFAIWFALIEGPFRIPRIILAAIGLYAGWFVMTEYPVLIGTGLVAAK